MAGVLEDLLVLAGLVSGPTAAPAPDNLVVHPSTPPTGIRLDATLKCATATVTSGAPPRLAFVLGPDSSLRGAGARLATLLPAGAPGVDDLARALLVYNAEVLGVAGAPRPVQVGFVGRAPVELQDGAWVTDAATIATLARGFPGAALARLDEPAAPLALPAPTDVTAVSTAYVATFAQAGGPVDLAALGADLARGLLVNPFDTCFLVMQVLRLPAVVGDASHGAAAAVALTQALADLAPGSAATPPPDQTDRLALLARFTAGCGILRRLLALMRPQAAADPTTSAVAATLRTALGLPADGDPEQSHCGVACAELPLPDYAATDRGGTEHPRAGVEAPGGTHLLAFGRDLCAGFVQRYPEDAPRFVGPAVIGRVDVAAFVRSVVAATNPGPELAERLHIVVAIAHNEGQLDAARLADVGVLSMGVQQWTSANADELPALLARFKAAAPDEYDFFFGLHDLQVDPGPGRGASTLRAVQPSGTAPLSLAGLARNTAFFGGTRAASGCVTYAPRWAAIVRAACLFSPTLRTTQIQQATDRFDRIRNGLAQFDIGRGTAPIEEIMTSEKAAALVLDAHINAHANVQSDLQDAINGRSRHHNGPVGAAITELTDDTRAVITDRYLAYRRLAYKPQRDAHIVAASTADGNQPAVLSSTAGTFAAWGADP